MNPVADRRSPTATLFAQIFVLTVLSLVVAQAVNIWIIFHLPRPTPEYYTAAEIVRALQQGERQASPREHALTVRRVSDVTFTGGLMPAPGLGRVRGELAGMLGVSPQDIVIGLSDRPYGRLTFLQARERLERKEPGWRNTEGAGRREGPGGGDRRGREWNRHEAVFLFSPFLVGVRQADGSWLTAQPPRQPLFNPWQMRITQWFLITCLAMAPMAWLFARRLSSSVALFAEAAERLGRDPNAPPLPIKGPKEIVPAIAAFNEMQDRLRRYVADRTAMTGAMAHDLRTPLTRLRFRIEAAPPEARAKMAADIDEMEAMVAGTLAYVRDSYGAGQRSRLELSSLLESVVDDLAETGLNASIDRADRVVLTGDPMSLRRMLVNLIENACKFGGAARARLRAEPGWAVFEIEDDGPGVPEPDLEKVFEPFYRGEPSRSRETGGSGLGLAVVRSIARLHGGDAVLRNRAGGGLLAEVRLPL